MLTRVGLSRPMLMKDCTIQLLQDLIDLAWADSGHMHFKLEPLMFCHAALVSIRLINLNLGFLIKGFDDRIEA